MYINNTVIIIGLLIFSIPNISNGQTNNVDSTTMGLTINQVREMCVYSSKSDVSKLSVTKQIKTIQCRAYIGGLIEQRSALCYTIKNYIKTADLSDSQIKALEVVARSLSNEFPYKKEDVFNDIYEWSRNNPYKWEDKLTKYLPAIWSDYECELRE